MEEEVFIHMQIPLRLSILCCTSPAYVGLEEVVVFSKPLFLILHDVSFLFGYTFCHQKTVMEMQNIYSTLWVICQIFSDMDCLYC